jgi:hypothetical protein
VTVDPYAGRDPTNPWGYCACGHPWMRHDVEEYTGDESEMCCVEGCDQAQCPGKVSRATAGEPQ